MTQPDQDEKGRIDMARLQDERDRLRRDNAELVEAMRAAIELSDSQQGGVYVGRTPECQAVYDKCVAALRAAAEGEPMCPRPANAAPPGPLSVRECIARGECGCDLRPTTEDEPTAP